MLGRQHLVITLVTVSGLISPFYFSRPLIGTAVLAGAVLGSLIPDIDGSDALIFHRKIFRIKTDYTQVLNIFPGILLPIFGYATKYAIYLPSVLLFKVLLPHHYRPEYGHRKYMHSILGLTTTALITGIILCTGLLLVDFLRIEGLILLGFFLTGYIFGGLMHLLEDACTKTGVMFFYPFSELRLHGRLITGKDRVKPHLMSLASAATLCAGLYLAYISGPLKAFETVSGLNLIFWVLFLGLVAEVELSW